MTPRDAALAAEATGISVLPPRQDGTKAPDSTGWAIHQQKRATPNQINRWYADGRTGVGWVCGAVSGNLEVIDFDDRSILAEYIRHVQDAGLEDLFTRIKAGYFEHTPNGAHLAYRCDTITGSDKLACRLPRFEQDHKLTLIETKGEGGYIIVAPTHGSVNIDGSYEMISGKTGTIETITPAERTLLHDLARTFDATPAVQSHEHRLYTGSGRVGDDYITNASWAEVLEPHGWIAVFFRLGVTSWRRPGKKQGISATTNHAGSDLLYVFSSSTSLEPNRGLNKFAVYTALNHGEGNFTEAAQALSLQGWGQVIHEPYQEVNIGNILAESRLSAPVRRARQSLDELLRVPGIVGEMAQWFTNAAYRPQPILALGAAVAACSTILARRVQTETGLRTNLYVLGIGTSGGGKEMARMCIKKMFSDINAFSIIGDSFASGAAIEAALLDSPTSLYLIDEIGYLFQSLKDNPPAYVRDMVSVLLSIYGESSSIHRCRTYGDNKRNQARTIHEPCLSLYCTAVPDGFYDNITRSQLSDGLLGRFLVFESDTAIPKRQRPDPASEATPQPILDWCQRWIANQGEGGDLRPEPRRIQATSTAWAVFNEMEDRLDEKKAEVIRKGESPGPYTRAGVMAMKLALIRACGIKSDPEVTEADALWGADLAWLLVCRFAERALGGLAETNTEKILQIVKKAVTKKGSTWGSRSDITRLTQQISSRDRKEALSTLVEIGEIEYREERVSARGPLTGLFRRKDFSKNLN